MAIKKVKYVEPAEYIPKHIRKELGLGEYAKKTKDKKAPEKKQSLKSK